MGITLGGQRGKSRQKLRGAMSIDALPGSQVSECTRNLDIQQVRDDERVAGFS